MTNRPHDESDDTRTRRPGDAGLRILLIEPIGRDTNVEDTRSCAQDAVGSMATVTVRHLPELPPTGYLPAEDVLFGPLLSAVRAGYQDGFHAVGIACASDPAVAEAKALVPIPVTGPFESAARLAGSLGRLSVLYPGVPSGPGENLPQSANWIRRLAHTYGISHLLGTSFAVPVDRPEHEVTLDGTQTAEDARINAGEVADNMERAITDRGPALAAAAYTDHDAECLFVACTLWSGKLAPVRTAVPVPVIDPITALARHTAVLAATVAA